jgi:perosamine synthetase
MAGVLQKGGYMSTDLTANEYGKYNGNESLYVLQALDSDNEENKKNPWTDRFESEFCKVTGVKYAVSCNSGTSGLHSALLAVGVGPGDEVIGPGLTVIMDAFAIIYTGATPVFADVDRDTMNIDPEDVMRKITPRTRAIIAVSLQGLPCDIDPLMDIAEKHGIVVIEDSAQTVLGRDKGRIAGTIGHLGVFSFENKKHLTCGSEGGMIVTNDENLAQKARKAAGIGYKHLIATAGRTSLGIGDFQDPSYERFDSVGFNYRMTEVCAAIGLAQLERIDFLVSRRQSVAALFAESVSGCNWMTPQSTPDGYSNSYYTFAVRYYGDEVCGVPWKQFYDKYKEMGGDGFYGACKVPYLEPVFRASDIAKLNKGSCPVAEKIQPTIMQFKTNYRNLETAKRKAEVLKKLIEKVDK